MKNELIQLLARLTTLQKCLLTILGATFLWAYWPVLDEVAHRWINDPQFSHGFLVPIFSVVLLWHRRSLLEEVRVHWSQWGFAFLGMGLLLHLAGAFLYVNWFDTVSLISSLFGVALLLGGWPMLRWAWPAIAFLFFMMPLPYRIEVAMAGPLRDVATTTSTYALQTLGFPAIQEGTNIYLKDLPQPLQIAPACSGLGMLLVFFTVSTAMVLVIERDWIDKSVILLSAIPIAIIANIVRITLTGILYHFAQSDLAKKFFHDWAGYLMMCVALGILWLELKIMSHLLVPLEKPRPLAIGYATPQRALPVKFESETASKQKN
jgi:exosortase